MLIAVIARPKKYLWTMYFDSVFFSGNMIENHFSELKVKKGWLKFLFLLVGEYGYFTQRFFDVSRGYRMEFFITFFEVLQTKWL